MMQKLKTDTSALSTMQIQLLYSSGATQYDWGYTV